MRGESRDPSASRCARTRALHRRGGRRRPLRCKMQGGCRQSLTQSLLESQRARGNGNACRPRAARANMAHVSHPAHGCGRIGGISTARMLGGDRTHESGLRDSSPLVVQHHLHFRMLWGWWRADMSACRLSCRCAMLWGAPLFMSPRPPREPHNFFTWIILDSHAL